MLRIHTLLFAILFFLSQQAAGQAKKIYVITKGSINFYSKTKQELIKASSDELRGAIDLNKKTFLFKINIASFVGFNNPVQREHFNENYMETERFPEATYLGKIIEDVDVSKNGEYDVRAKGKLKIHGIEQEKIIKSHIVCKDGVINISSDFIVPLAEHDIKIPRIVYDKLAPDINVTVTATLKPNN